MNGMILYFILEKLFILSGREKAERQKGAEKKRKKRRGPEKGARGEKRDRK